MTRVNVAFLANEISLFCPLLLPFFERGTVIIKIVLHVKMNLSGKKLAEIVGTVLSLSNKTLIFVYD